MYTHVKEQQILHMRPVHPRKYQIPAFQETEAEMTGRKHKGVSNQTGKRKFEWWTVQRKCSETFLRRQEGKIFYEF